MTATDTPRRHVLLLETDERAGLVAAIADTCAAHRVSLEITTGPEHVLMTIEATPSLTATLKGALATIPGVADVHTYPVATAG